MPQDASQRRSEGQSDLGMHLNLIDAIELVFDRIFGRDDFGFGTANLQQAAVQRRRLARTGRAGHQDDAVGQRMSC
jgi:hypothetical protein